MSTSHQTVETAAGITAKLAPPATVSIASVAGYQVSELLLWATLVYTILMICHKLYAMIHDYTEHKRLEREREREREQVAQREACETLLGERRSNEPDLRPIKVERRQP